MKALGIGALLTGAQVWFGCPRMSHTFGGLIECPKRALNVRPRFLDPWSGFASKRAGAISLDGGPARAELRGWQDRLSLTQLAAAFLRRLPASLGLFLIVALSGCAAPGHAHRFTRFRGLDLVSQPAGHAARSKAGTKLSQAAFLRGRGRSPSRGDRRFRLPERSSGSVGQAGPVRDIIKRLPSTAGSNLQTLERRPDRSHHPEARQAHGYLLANTPAQGEIVRIGGHQVLYVGRGN